MRTTLSPSCLIARTRSEIFPGPFSSQASSWIPKRALLAACALLVVTAHAQAATATSATTTLIDIGLPAGRLAMRRSSHLPYKGLSVVLPRASLLSREVEGDDDDRVARDERATSRPTRTTVGEHDGR